MNLYELTDAFRRIQDLPDGEMDPETGEWVVSQEMREILDAAEGAFDDKIESIAKVIRSLEAEVATIKDEAKRLEYRRKGRERKIEWLRGYARDAMDAVGKSSIKTPLFSMGVQDSAAPLHVTDQGKRALLKRLESDPSLEEYMKPVPPREVNKSAIARAIRKGGVFFEGIGWGEKPRSFRIR
jgi:hypothetical protein